MQTNLNARVATIASWLLILATAALIFRATTLALELVGVMAGGGR